MEEGVKRLLADELWRRRVEENSSHIPDERHLVITRQVGGYFLWSRSRDLRKVDLLLSGCGIWKVKDSIWWL